MKKLRIGTRPSELALVQTNLVAEAILQIDPECTIEVCKILSTGDQLQSVNDNSTARDKKIWVDGLEQALLSDEVDIAVHSAKDIPSDYSKATIISSVLPRQNAFDCFVGSLNTVTSKRSSFESLEKAAQIGTASLRRKAQLKYLNTEFDVIPHRGNVPTRIRKLDESDSLNGIILATAGILRLKMDLEYEVLTAEQMLPAANQGILAVQYLKEKETVAKLSSLLVDQNTQACFVAERSCVEKLEAGCQSALGVYATVSDEKLTVTARVLSEDGRVEIKHTIEGNISTARALGDQLGQELLHKGAQDLL